MSPIRDVLLLLFLLNNVGNYSFSQTKTLSKKEITRLIKESANSLNAADFEKSMAKSRLALHYANLINDDILIANSYIIIAANFDELSEFDKAISFNNKALFYANKISNDTLKDWINNNLGNIYSFEKKQYDVGINYYKKSLEYSEKRKDTAQIALTKLNIAWAYFYFEDYNKGAPYLDFINKYHKKFGNKSTVVALNMLNGMYYGHKGDNKKATSSFLNAIELGIKGTEKSDLSYSYEEYSKFLLKNGDYKNAYQNLALYNKIKQELYDESKIKKANVVGINFELDEYKREVKKIETEKEIQYQSLKKTKIIVVLFIFTLLVLLLFLYSLYMNNNFKKKANADLMFANEELIIAKEKADKASLAKTQFVSTISHELRTPLYGVVGITNMLLDEHKELANSPHLSSLKFSARYLLSLVNDILQINKIEENRIVLESSTFNILDEIDMIKNSLTFLAQNHKNTLTAIVDPAIPEYLIGDKLRLAQVLMNLVSNALKFTKNGEVIIIAKLVEVKNKSHSIEFQIKDNGTGIAEADQVKIFDKFVQVGRKDNDYQGTGLGLSIVKQLLILFNSTISLESKIGKGTTFTFKIAFDYDPIKTNEIINNIQVDLRSSQIFKVLIVEDNKINQIITRKIIEKYNCSCILADDGFQALEILEKENFDVILMDINMPLMNGFETTRKIRHKGIKIPIIALTAFNKEEIAEEAISAGMNDIIVKPFEPILLFQVINNQIAKKKNADKGQRSFFELAEK